MSVHPDADRIDWEGMKNFDELRKSMDEAIAKAKEVIQASEVVPVTAIVTNTFLIRGKEPVQPTP